MSRSLILAASFLFALPAAALAQTDSQTATAPAAQAPAGPPPEVVNAVQAAGMAFGTCVESAVGTVPANVTPEAGTTNVLATCAAQRQALTQATQALIAALPEAQRAAAQQQISAQLDAVPAQITAGIQAMRAAPAATPVPAPAQ